MYVYRHICTRLFTIALLLIVKNRNNLNVHKRVYTAVKYEAGLKLQGEKVLNMWHDTSVVYIKEYK